MAERFIEYLAVDDLQPAPLNPKAHHIDVLDESMERFGYTDPIELDERSGRLVSGHGRVEALQRRRQEGKAAPEGVRVDGDRWLVPVVRGWASTDDDEAAAYLVGANRSTEIGGWHDSELAALLETVAASPSGLTGVGYTDDDLQQLLVHVREHDRQPPGDVDPDDIPEPPAEPITKAGDLWLLGDNRHRILCGDSTDREAVDRVLNGEHLAGAVVSDPPYGVGIGAKNRALDAIDRAGRVLTDLEGDRTMAEVEPLWRAAFAVLADVMPPGTPYYMSGPLNGDLGHLLYRLLRDVGLGPRHVLIWVKNRPSFSIGQLDYDYQHEPIVYGWKRGGAHPWYATERQTTVIHIDRPQASPEHPCLPPGEDVLTDEGWRPIETLRQGDRVLSHDGCFHAVEAVTTTPFDGEVVVVETAGTHGVTRATGNHPFLVARAGAVGWVRADGLRPGDLALTPVIDRPTRVVDTDWAWAVGLWAAEGYTQKAGHGGNRYLCYAVHAEEGDLFEKRLDLAFPGSSIKRYPNGPGGNGITLRVFSPQFTDEVVRIAGRYSHLKRLHPDVFGWDAPARRALLDGYLAGDGYHLRSEHRAKTVSSDLAASLMLLSESVGRSFSARLYAGGDRAGFGRTLRARPCWHMAFKDGPRPTVEYEGYRFGARRIRAVSTEPHYGVVVNLTVEGAHTFHTVAGMTHNTTKPVELIRRLIENSTRPGGMVLDGFLGSGTTAVACEMTGRRCRGIEISPHYTDVALRRWQRLVGEKPVLERTGEPFDFLAESVA